MSEEINVFEVRPNPYDCSYDSLVTDDIHRALEAVELIVDDDNGKATVQHRKMNREEYDALVEESRRENA